MSLGTTLSESQSKSLLAGYGLPLPTEHLAATAPEAVAAARTIGYPVVAKLEGDAIAHKTERGLVRLKLADDAAVESAAAELLAAATADDGEVRVLVAPMIGGNRELIVGLLRDPQFGATVMLGLGGILAEAVADVVFRPAPLDETTAREMIDDLATQQLLGEFRGEAAVDRDAVVTLLVGLGRLAVERPDVASVDVNPLIITADGAPIAFFPFRQEPPRGPLSLKRATLLTDGTFDSDYHGLCIHPGIEEEALDLCLDLLVEEARSQAIVLSGIPEGSVLLPALRNVLNRRGLPRRERPANGLSAELPDSFTAYLAGLKPRMRTKIRQALRNAKANGARYARCDDTNVLEGRLSEMFDLHEQRWVAVGQDGAFADLRRRHFYRSVGRLAMARGALRLTYMVWRGRRVAYQFGIIEGDRYYQMQEGYDPEFTDLRLGVALRAMSIERLIEEGVRHYDFMGGDSSHKRDWGGVPRPCTTIAFALPRWRAKLAYGLRALLDRRSGDGEEIRASA